MQQISSAPAPTSPSAEVTRQPGAHICVAGLTHQYRHAEEKALDNIGFTIEPGERVALIGRSGCGKSTLLHIMAGLLKPSQGEVRIDGERVDRPSPRWIMMFQQPSLLPWLTVSGNVALGLRFTGRRREAPSRIAKLLRLVELEGLEDRNVQDLSGGQQQRVALARSLVLAPEALLLDEPFSALDAFTRSTLQRDVRRIARELGLTLLIVTHDINEAAVMADRALIMTPHPGRIRADILLRSETAGADSFEQARRVLVAAYESAAGLTIGAQGGEVSI
ncbi:MAG: ABC transporter ATP-binding protein [Rhodomicrobium sp.]